jgi:hypothetical protein
MANGTLAASQLEMLSQSGTGIMTIVPPATNTNQTLTLPDSTGTVATLGTSLTLATAVASTSGTSIDFTSIPSWVKRVTVMFNGMSTNGTSFKLVQLGTSSGVSTTGYRSSSVVTSGGAGGGTNSTAGFIFYTNNAANIHVGQFVASLVNASTNTWVGSHAIGLAGENFALFGGGDSTLSGTLDRVRITTVNGTDTFDAGTINIMYEG